MNFETKSRSDKSSNKDFTGNAKDYAKNIIKPLETQSLTPEFIAFFKKAINIQITKEIIRSNILDSLRNSNSSERNQLTKATFGTGDPKVRIAQASLVLAGYDLGDYGANGVDGKPGKLTIQAIKDFQQAVGLKPNGDLNEPTMFALDFITKKGFMRNEIEFIGKE